MHKRTQKERDTCHRHRGADPSTAFTTLAEVNHSSHAQPQKRQWKLRQQRKGWSSAPSQGQERRPQPFMPHAGPKARNIHLATRAHARSSRLTSPRRRAAPAAPARPGRRQRRARLQPRERGGSACGGAAVLPTEGMPGTGRCIFPRSSVVRVLVGSFPPFLFFLNPPIKNTLAFLTRNVAAESPRSQSPCPPAAAGGHEAGAVTKLKSGLQKLCHTVTPTAWNRKPSARSAAAVALAELPPPREGEHGEGGFGGRTAKQNPGRGGG